MPKRPVEDRYDTFCEDAHRLLEEAGLADSTQEPRITGQAFYEACLNLARIHFPDDTEVSGKGPLGLIWGMYSSVARGKDLNGALGVAATLKHIIKYRPPLQKESRAKPTGHANVPGQQCPFFEPTRKYAVRKDLVFVLMPFREPWSDRLWNDHIREYLSPNQVHAPIEVRRADEMFGQGVMEDVWEGIVTARLVLAECTGRNPNVLYELGLAHAIGKRTVLLSQKEDDIPFDLRRFRFCIYEDNSGGYPTLRRFLHETFREIIQE